MRVSLLLTSLLLALAPVALAQQVAPAAQDRRQQQAPARPAQLQEDQEDPAAQVGSSDDPSAAESKPSEVPLEEIRRFVAVFNAVKQAYVEPVDDKKLMHSAIRGLLLDLDPHSAYLDKEDAQSFDEQANGAYDGIGVELLAQPDGTLKVVAPIDGTPAARAGIQSGDVIIAIDGKPLGSGEDSMGPLRGPPGSKVTLTIVRDRISKPFDKTLTRETIRVASVRWRMLEPGYGYIRISAFQADTGADFQKAVDELEAKGPLKGVVLDLRSNPGGLHRCGHRARLLQLGQGLADRLVAVEHIAGGVALAVFLIALQVTGKGGFAVVGQRGGQVLVLGLVGLEHHLRHDASGLDRLAAGREVARGGQLDRITVVQRQDRLHRALAEGA